MACKCCGSPITVGSGPFYDEVSGQTLQNHETVLTDTVYAAGLIIKESFNIPALGEDIPVKLTKVYNIVVGSYLYSPAYGYLKISNYNPNTNTIGLLNDGVKGTAVPGTFVSENTIFIVTSRPCCEDDASTLFPFLAEDFVAPGVGLSATIPVTSTFGLRLDGTVRIGAGLYRLTTINSSKEIVITNEGAGYPVGEIIEALDVSGDFQHLITVELSGECAAPTTLLGRLHACEGAEERILGGGHAGQVPVLQNAADNTVAFEFLDAGVKTCTHLTASLVITSGIGTYAGVEVETTSGFVIGDLLEINFGSLRFEITAIDAGLNTFDLEMIPNPPGVDLTIVSGAIVCKVLTTELLQDEIDALNFTLDGVYARIDGTNAAGIVDTTWLQNNIVTFAKMQDIATDRLIGRDTVGSGDPQELLVTGGLEFTGSGGIQRSVLTGDVTATAGSNTTTIANNAVTTAKILDNAVTTAKLPASAVTTLRIADANVTTAKIADNNVTEAKLHDDAASRSTVIATFFRYTPENGSTIDGPMYRSVIEAVQTPDGVTQPVQSPALRIPKACKVTHLSIAAGGIPITGNATATLKKNGASTSQSLALNTTGSSRMSAITAQSFAADDTLSLDMVYTSFTLPAPSVIAVDVWGHFTV